MTKAVEISSAFVGQFKVGDNIVHNANVLCELVSLKNDALNKPIVIQAGSLIEACMSQIIYRAKNFHKEGVPNISEEERAEIADKKADKFAVMIDVFKKHKILDGVGGGIYEELHKLRKYRNKVHIQENVGIEGAPVDEDELFSANLRGWALGTTFKVIKFISEAYARPKHIEGYVQNFKLPCA